MRHSSHHATAGRARSGNSSARVLSCQRNALTLLTCWHGLRNRLQALWVACDHCCRSLLAVSHACRLVQGHQGLTNLNVLS
jgi:hypothetical protein